MEKHPLNFRSDHCDQHAVVLTNPAATTERRLVLLHGAGVAGELSWTYVANYLTGWREILIPDLAGMGKSRFLSAPATGVAPYAQQLDELTGALDWQEFDVAGYSFGGIVAEHWLRSRRFNGLCFLLEPAMLYAADAYVLLNKAQLYQQVAEQITANPADSVPYVRFLDSVSPARNRQDKTEQLTIARLQANALGFAQALAAVSAALQQQPDHYLNWVSPWAGAGFVGSLSEPAMHERHRQLAAASRNWQFEVVDGADHSLVFTRPRAIAAVMNRCLAER